VINGKISSKFEKYVWENVHKEKESTKIQKGIPMGTQGRRDEAMS
jgi:hypothetical protein